MASEVRDNGWSYRAKPSGLDGQPWKSSAGPGGLKCLQCQEGSEEGSSQREKVVEAF